ncbi:ricin-type beta-trefoil lectin domain protein [Streptomyces sp. NPDC048512]|uniref:ricin-type beta-trefoil lectin domain protein n=1 Tax=Streptomyces sp. NPDC048512 TaxID=3365563 RepID=UPI0037236170
MNDSVPPPSPGRGRLPEVVPDARLAAELRQSPGGTPATRPVGELLDRHWESVFAYARLCTDGVGPAGMLTTASFTRLFGDSLHQGGPTAAWRPHLLVTVRRMAGEWLADERRELLSPDLLADVDRADPQTDPLLPPEGRRLLARAFQRLPEAARCLLWHGETEGERLAVPAALLGLPVADAPAELRRARERLREACLEIHRELAPEGECRGYHRMLDVSLRRGGAELDPDLRLHMNRCGHCRYAADQLNQFNGSLAVPLAEAVLGWGAVPYAASRRTRAPAAPAMDAPGTGRGAEDPAGRYGPTPGTPGTGPGWETPPHGADPIVEFHPRADVTLPPGAPPLPPFPPQAAPVSPATVRAEPVDPSPSRAAGPRSRRRAPARPGRGRPSRRGVSPSGTRAKPSRGATPHKGARRAPSRRNVTLAVLTVGALILVPLVLWAAGAGSDEPNGKADGSGSSGAPRPHTGSTPSWTGAGGRADGASGALLRNTTTGLCVGIAGAQPAAGVETRLTSCDDESVRTWSYGRDGLLRDAAEPGLCLDSRLSYSVRLAPCAGASEPGAKNVRYDLTAQGRLVARWNKDLVLVPAAVEGESALVLKTRDDDDPAQRWTLDTASPSPRTQLVNWGASAEPAPPSTTPGPGN